MTVIPTKEGGVRDQKENESRTSKKKRWRSKPYGVTMMIFISEFLSDLSDLQNKETTGNLTFFFFLKEAFPYTSIVFWGLWPQDTSTSLTASNMPVL